MPLIMSPTQASLLLMFTLHLGWCWCHRLRAAKELRPDWPRSWTGRAHHGDWHGLHWEIEPQSSVFVQVSGRRGKTLTDPIPKCWCDRCLVWYQPFDLALCWHKGTASKLNVCVCGCNVFFIHFKPWNRNVKADSTLKHGGTGNRLRHR